MKPTQKFVLALSIIIVLAVPLVVSAAAAGAGRSGFYIVPCTNNCTFDDLIRGAVRVINLLFAGAAIVATYYILVAGWQMMSSLGKT